MSDSEEVFSFLYFSSFWLADKLANYELIILKVFPQTIYKNIWHATKLG
jgi:hypothetical protein